MSEPDTEALRRALAAPFSPEEVKFKPQAIAGGRALAVPFVDARTVMDRLDDVFGVGGWMTSYREAKDGIICTLRVRLGQRWAVHEDIGGESEQPDDGDKQKAAFSDSLKRAAVHLGVGRYLYRVKPQWCDYDPQKRRFTQEPQLPVEALPARRPPQAQPATKDAPPGPAMATKEQMEEMLCLKKDASMSDEAFVNLMHTQFGVRRREHLERAQAEQFLAMLRRQSVAPRRKEMPSGSPGGGH